MSRRDIVNELIQIRSRRGRDEIIASFSQHEFAAIINRAKRDYDIVLKLIPILAVTSIEVMTRSLSAKLIDQGSPYIDRAENIFKRLDFKADFKTIVALQGKDITIGDILSHLINISKIDDVGYIMTTLLGCDYFSALSAVRDRFDIEVHGTPSEPILGDRSNWYATINEIFLFRHIIAHETSQYDLISIEKARTFAVVSEQFLRASWELVANTLEPNYPLTQTDMNIAAAERFTKEDGHLKSLIKEIEQQLESNPQELSLFRDAQSKWELFREAQAIFRHNPEGGGSIGPMLRALEAHSLTIDRIKFCEWWINRKEDEL